VRVLIPRAEAAFHFKGARFNLQSAEERRLLGWVFNQFLYGEVTGIQCGHWLYRAPHLNAAAFLAKQAGEELSHVRKILRVLSLLGERPAPAHWSVRFLSTGMMGGSWGEHVALEMALGEGLVLAVFYALADTIDQPEIHKILESAAVEEERHVEFGERETRAWLAAHPGAARGLLAQCVLQTVALRALRGFVLRTLARRVGQEHPVLRQFPEFYDHVLATFERRMERLGLGRPPGALGKALLLAELPLRWLVGRIRPRGKLLTATYLGDPMIQAEAERLEK
jgi:hypothetical protein